MVEEHESMWLMSLHLRKGTRKDGVETKLQAACPRWCVWVIGPEHWVEKESEVLC